MSNAIVGIFSVLLGFSLMVLSTIMPYFIAEGLVLIIGVGIMAFGVLCLLNPELDEQNRTSCR